MDHVTYLITATVTGRVIGWGATYELAESVRQEIAWQGIATAAPVRTVIA